VIGVGRNRPAQANDSDSFRFVELDLSVTETIASTLDHGIPANEPVDFAILSAGTHGPMRASATVSIAEIESVIRLNTLANKVILDWLMSREQRPEQVVAISSGAAFNGSGGWLAYCLSKTSLNLLLRVYSHEYPDTHFAAVAPGLVNTKMLKEIRELPADERFPANARIRSAYDERRVQEPDEVARKFWDLMPKVRGQQSGSFVDLRDL
jgi:NAD(P)-dependent dehydrogenase (short-subunit alcohol dehydrogenase family)